ncbi:helix-turn-helix domain-containing protein [Aquimarina sp. 2201CG1-2-11]|uniref:helix-turn-helix domain-containing protein n=1 Tax=Aquimarina discodermiae TaxID=3231043 RepID=UPI003462150F
MASRKRNLIHKGIFISIIALCLFFKTGFSQNGTIAKDSLSLKTYNELESLFKKHKLDSTLSKAYAWGYIQKAKREKDSLQMANGYYYISKVCKDDVLLSYLDSLIIASKNIKSVKYPGVGYINKGTFYYHKENYPKALENYLIAQKYAQSSNNTHHLIVLQHNMGLLKKVVGDNTEALKIFKQNLKVIKTKDTLDKYSKTHLVTLYSIGDAYHRLSVLGTKINYVDSATSYINRGISKSYKRNDKYMYHNFLLLNGTNNFLIKKHKTALDSLYKASQIIRTLGKHSANESYCYQQIALVLTAINKRKEAFKYLLKMDSVTDINTYTDEKRKSYEALINYYKSQKDVQNQLKTMSKLITYDSAFYARNKNVKSDVVIKYDTEKLINERESIIQSLKKEKKYSNVGFIAFIIISIISIFLVIRYYHKQKIYKKRFENLAKEKTTPISQSKPIANTIKENIPWEIAEDILLQLEKFENELGYLKSDLKMNSVAKKMKTNSSYFSKVINLHKQKNFTNYINDLRIEYCITKLKTDSKFRLYSIEAIAKEVGFSSVQSFSRAFTKKTGITASYFIKNIT